MRDEFHEKILGLLFKIFSQHVGLHDPDHPQRRQRLLVRPFLIFLAQSMLIKLTSPQAGWLSIFFGRKTIMLHLLEGPELRTRY